MDGMLRKVFVAGRNLRLASVTGLCTLVAPVNGICLEPVAGEIGNSALPHADGQEASDEAIALLYLSCGNANLMSQNYKSAIENYHKAFNKLDSSQNSGIEFLVSFGMAIACDHLHLIDRRDSNISRMRAMIDIANCDEELELESMPYEDDTIPAYLRALANMASSIEIQGILQSFILEIFPFSLAHFSCEAPLMAHRCKSFWKRLEKFGHNIIRTCEKILDILERFCDIKDRLQGMPKQIPYKPYII